MGVGVARGFVHLYMEWLREGMAGWEGGLETGGQPREGHNLARPAQGSFWTHSLGTHPLL